MAVVVLIDDDPLQARLIIDNLGADEHIVVWVQRSWEGLLLTYQLRPDLLLLDCGVAQWHELLLLMRSIPSLDDLPRILITNQHPSAYYLKKFGVVDCLDRHLDAETLVQQVQQVLTHRPPDACPLLPSRHHRSI